VDRGLRRPYGFDVDSTPCRTNEQSPPERMKALRSTGEELQQHSREAADVVGRAARTVAGLLAVLVLGVASILSGEPVDDDD
jgi:hypothetical protein